MFASTSFFWAAGAGVVSPLPGGESSDYVLFSGTATAGWTFSTAGNVTDEGESGNHHQWYSPPETGIGAGYWVRATLNSGTSPSGAALATWLSLASVARQWTLTRSTQGTSTCSLTISIATDAAGTNVVATGTYVITASFDA